jgi:glycosyltransferase involved in cell wall biosynthesis
MKTAKSESSGKYLVDGAVALLTGGQDIAYTYGLATTLAGRGIHVDVVGGERVDHIEFHTSAHITFVDLGGIRKGAGSAAKFFQLTMYYLKLFMYLTFRSPKIIHTLWNSKLEYFDRTFLTFYLKILGKKLVLTAHNVNKAKRDSVDSTSNRLTLTMQYRLTDRIFVHTEKMKDELIREFSVLSDRIPLIPFGINTLVPDTELTTTQAKRQLGIGDQDRTILFYGRIVPYKGLEYLVEAFHRLAPRDANIRLMVAGEPMKGSEDYIRGILQSIAENAGSNRIQCRLEYISDSETELYFKAADVLALPYKDIFESGVLYVAYRFGLPVVASDVGSFGEELTEGNAGMIFEPCNSTALADALEAFFKSVLYTDAENQRHRIRSYSTNRHSWDTVGKITECVYSGLVKQWGNAGNGDLATDL